MKFLPLTVCLGSCLAVSFFHGAARADFPELLRQVPYSANKIAMINVEDYRSKSSEAVKQEVAQMLDASEALPLIAPWNPTKIVTAAEVDVAHMAPSWEMIAVEFEQAPDMEKLARSANGVVETLLDHQVAWLQNAGVMKTGEKQLTIVSPLSRQSAARWLRRIDGQRGSDLSPYLQSAIEPGMGDGEIVQIIDLSNVFEPNSVRSVVAASPLLNRIQPDPTNLLCSVRGVTIVVNVEDNTTSSITVDFGSPVQPLAPVAKQFMIGALTKAGAMLDEFDNWNFSAVEKSISMTGPLTPNGISRILSLSSLTLVQAHHHVADVADDNKAPVTPPVQDSGQPPESKQMSDENSQMFRATRNYFRRIKSALADVGRGQDLNRLDRSALWVNNKVRSIEGMTTRNVDPEMIEYGQKVTQGLSDIVHQYHYSEIQTQERLAPIGQLGPTTVTAIPWRSTNYGGRRRYDYAPMVSQDIYLGRRADGKRCHSSQ